MGTINWLIHDDQKELFDLLLAIILNLLFLALIALLLWPLGRVMMAFQLTKGYGLFWVIVFVTSAAVKIIERIFRLGPEPNMHFSAYVILNLSVSGFLLAGWSAFAAITVHVFAAGTPVWIAAILYLIGFLSSYIAFLASCPFYMGQIYRLVNAPLALAGFLIFAVWPASGRMIYGWFFDL